MELERLGRALASTLVALLVAGACASLLILAYGQSPLAVYRLMLDGTWGNGYGIGQVLFKATPLVLTGLAVAIPLEAGLFNVGAEGQLACGAFATGLVGAALPPSLWWPIALALCLGAGALAGGAVGAIPGALKGWRGAHEVIVTIMLNFVVLAKLADWGKPFYLRESVHTPVVPQNAQLSRISDFADHVSYWRFKDLLHAFHGSAVSTALFLSLAVALAAWLFLAHTSAGFRLRVVGRGRDVAETAGISVARQTFFALTLGGAIAGLVGANAVLGYKRYYEEGFSGGIGFMGIAVALVGRNHPLGIVLAAIFFGTLSQGGLAVNAVVPKELVDVLQGVILVAMSVAAAWSERELRRRLGGSAA